MDKKFSANTFHADHEYDVLTVGLADDSEDPVDFIILQRSDEVDEQDQELGLDTYYVEIGNPGVAGYGGVDRVEIFSDRIIFNFVGSCDWVKPIKAIEVNTSGVSEDVNDIYSALSKIFHGDTPLVRF
ncbi:MULTISPECIES: Imm10 family immunity protein [Pseudomonas]|uniref:Immunity protein 10 n=1 Tax=Pseudomonas taiwanensis TaxID=470150 RepID=A0ABR6VH87_9PSED|nr:MULTISPECIES: Imm10 family immunity protein [Pseudomonas]AVD89305.1 hypothetical protein C4Q26_20085 [Pseudomonas sp. SWI44]MBC3478942.1 hypothetical protein [Pseudomonas taiwanensis]MBC3494309.1 hypothetical protein [Pseudomonas taiwanensis]QQZ34817.1 hypothetical protein IF103_16380 [Pseudomonas sp. SK2]